MQRHFLTKPLIQHRCNHTFNKITGNKQGQKSAVCLRIMPAVGWSPAFLAALVH